MSRTSGEVHLTGGQACGPESNPPLSWCSCSHPTRWPRPSAVRSSKRAAELNKRIIPVLRRSVDGLPVPPALERPNWIFARPEDDFEASVTSLVEALELDEACV